MGIQNALSVLSLDCQELLSSPHATTIPNPALYLKNLADTVVWLQARLDSGRPPKAPTDAAAIWEGWAKAEFVPGVLQPRELRSLCLSPEFAMRDELVFELSRDPEPIGKFTTFLGFAHAYFAHWRSTSQAALVEALLGSALNTKAIRERQSRVIASWAGAPFLFSHTADARLADHLLIERGTLTQLRESFFLEPGCALLQKATERAAEKEVQTLVTKEPAFSPEQILIRLQWLREEVLRPDFDAENFRDLLAKIILSNLPARSLPIQTMLMNWIYADPRLGDPRLVNRASNWRKVVPEARSRFLSWLAKETLQFFFDTIVPPNDANRRRAEFWLRYAKRDRNIIDFQVVVSREDEWKIRQARTRAVLVPEYAKLISNESNPSSAFLMAFQGGGGSWIIAEFSETGSAAHIFRQSDFERGGTRLSAVNFERRQIHNPQLAVERIIHIGRWEPTAVAKLAGLGIHP
jgi:EH_Signature domain